MNPGTGNVRQGGWMPGRRFASGMLVCWLLLVPGAWSQRGHNGGGGGGARGGMQARPVNPGPRMNGNGRPRMNPGNQEMRPYARPGQTHLPQWMAQHQNMTPQQQENLLRREPGFNRLTPDQQQRVMNRLRSLDARPLEQRERILQRQEMFEHLSPEQKQDVRGAAQAMAMMPPQRHAIMARAFNDLRTIPPEQRQEILNSARFSHTFTPQERHILGSMLSVEPYQPR